MEPFTQTLFNLVRARFQMEPRAMAMLLVIGHASNDEQRTVGTIIKALNIPNAAGSRHGKQLETDGYLTRHFYPPDNRSVMYRLTAKGRTLVARIEAGYRQRARAQ